MKEKTKIEILGKVIDKFYTKNPGMQKLIEKSMIDICKEESVLSEQVFFLLFFAVGFIVMSYLNMNFLCAKDSL